MERSCSPSGSGRSPAAKRFLVNCRLKIAPVVAMLQNIPVHDRSQKTQYVILYVNHNIPSIVQWDPKASVLLWLERRRPAQNERHQKQYISGASRDFFQVVEVVQKQRYFKFVISASHS